MRKFAFRLERVLQWRGLEARTEESRLERMRGELRAIDEQSAGFLESLAQAGHVISGNDSSALDLASLSAFRRHVGAQQARLNAARAECLRRIERQADVLASKLRQEKLLQKLKDRNREQWAADLDRETVQQIENAYAARRQPRRSRDGRARSSM